MPKMNGVEAARKLRVELPDLKVIGLSAYDKTHDQAAAICAEGAVACVLKESSCQKLSAVIRASGAG